MIELEKISLKEYIELEEERRVEYDFAMKYAFCFTEPVDEYKVGDFMELSFGFIKDLQYNIEQGIKFDQIIKTISELTNLKDKDLGSEPFDKIIRFSNYIKESIKQIVEVESEKLGHEPEPDEEQAGIERFEGLGVYLQIRSLTGGDVTKFEAVRNMPYSVCFTEMYTAKQLNEYEKELTEIMKRKNQNG